VLSAGPIRVVVVDDHPVVRDGVASQLESFPDMVVVGDAATGSAAVALCAARRPDVVLLDLRLPDGPAEVVVPRILAVAPAARVVLFTAFPGHGAVGPTLAAGACGLLVKDVSGPALGLALREVVRTGSPPVRRRDEPQSPITPQEYAVLRLVAVGQTNSEIGGELALSVNTVKAYLSSTMHKLGARNRAQVIARALARGLL
jgi:DNA-binding NarL/FixJ family response regulator